MKHQKKTSIKPKGTSPEKSHLPYILLVEDEPTHIAVMSHTIRSANPHIALKVADSLKEYRSTIAISLPEIVLIDMHLPDGKALEVLTSPLETGFFPIVVMTSSGDEKTAVKAMKAGALDYIVKSTETFKAMPHTIERALREWKLIQEHKRAEEELRESELRFRTLYENVTIGLYRTTPVGKILLANRALVKMLGYSSFEELAERNLAKAGFAQSSQRKVFLRNIEMEGEVHDFESTWTRQDGSLVIVRESARAIRDAQGKTLYYDGSAEDITERRLAEVASRHAENALRESEEKFKYVFECSTVGKSITLPSGEINVNKAFCDLLGYTQQELQQKKWQDITHPEDIQLTQKAIDMLLSGGQESTRFEKRFLHKNGSIMWVDLSSFVRKDKDEKPLYLITTLIDITERKRAEEAVQASHDRLHLALESANSGIWQWDLITNENIWSDELWKLYGIELNSCAPSYGAWRQTIHPEDRENTEKKVQEAARNGSSLNAEWRVLDRDGRVRWLMSHGRPVFNTKGKAVRFIGIVSDITERKQAEEQLEMLKHSVDKHYDGAYWMDTDNKFIYVNEAGCNALGYKREELIGMKVSEVNPMANAESLSYIWEHLRMNGYATMESIHRRKDGSEFPVEIVATYLHFGNKEYNCGFARDITERKRAEKALRDSKLMLQIVLDSIPAAVFWKNRDLIYIGGNRTWLKAAGLQIQDEVVGKNDYDLPWEKEQADAFREYDKKIIESGIPQYDIIEPYLQADGTQAWAKTNKVPLRDADGNIIGVLGTYEDITERRQAEEALRQSEEKFRKVFESANVGKSITLPTGELYVNEAFCDMLGYKKEELRNKKWQELTPPDEVERIQNILDTLLIGEKDSVRFNKRYIHKDGLYIWADISIVIVRDLERKPLHFITTVIDITERKRVEDALRNSEEKYRLLFENNPVSMWVYNTESLAFLAVNDFAVDQYGYSREEFLNMTIKDIRPPEDIPYLQEVLNKYTGQIRKVGTARHRKKDGSLIDVEITGHEIEFEGHHAMFVLALDITERKQTEDALRASESQFRELWGSTVEGITILDKEIIIEVNDAICQMFGIPREYAVGKSLLEFAPAEMHDHIRERLELRTEGRFEISALRADGTRITLETFAKQIFYQSKPLRMVVARDITEQKQAERTLRENEQFFRLLFTTSPDSILLFDPFSTDVPWKILDCNEVACRMNGYTREELIGKSVDMLNVKILTPEERESHIKVLQQKGVAYFETQHRHRDGHIYPIDVSSSLVTLGGRQLILGIDRDITGRKRIEEAVLKQSNFNQLIIENAGEGICVCHNINEFPYVQFTLWNEYMIAITGYSMEEINRLGWYQSMYPDPAVQKQAIARMERMRIGDNLQGEEWEVTRADGQKRQLRLTTRLLNEDEGTPNILGVMSDITEHRQVEEAVRQMQKLEGLGTLAGGIAHDFNNILGIILAYITSIKRFKDDTKKLDLATETITKAVDRGKTLVQQILTFARKTEIEFKAVNVNDVVMEIMNMIYETFPKTLTYTQNFDKTIPFINADRSQLYQVMLNLCVNARDAMPTSGVLTINTCMVSAVSLRNQHPDVAASSYVCIEINDTGEGMTEEVKKRIFEPFFTTKGIGKGTGLGLAVVFGVVQTHKGFIDVESELGKGTTFRLYLPVTQLEEPISIENEESLEEIPGGSETLLVVEDEEMLMLSLRMVLVEKGYNVLSAGDGLTAMKIFQERKNDIALVLTDLGLPNISGLEVCQRIKKINPNEHMILVTGFLDPDTKSEFLKAGIQHFLYKPYDLKKVLKVVREVLDRK